MGAAEQEGFANAFELSVIRQACCCVLFTKNRYQSFDGVATRKAKERFFGNFERAADPGDYVTVHFDQHVPLHDRRIGSSAQTVYRGDRRQVGHERMGHTIGEGTWTKLAKFDGMGRVS